jgi:hypothetical protein
MKPDNQDHGSPPTRIFALAALPASHLVLSGVPIVIAAARRAVSRASLALVQAPRPNRREHRYDEVYTDFT